MLSSLHIENIAVIKKADIDFEPGFNVLTGETGAGKSILIDSINLLLGARPSRDLIRNGETRADVSALFSGVEAPPEGSGEEGLSPDEDGCLYLTREFDTEGKSKTRLGGKAVPVSLQKEVVARLIVIHGQNDNRLLAEGPMQLHYLDSYAGNEELLAEYRKHYAGLCECASRIGKLDRDGKEKARAAELLAFQVADINEAKLKPGEEEELEAKRGRLKNAEKIGKATRRIVRSLYRSEKSPPAFELVRRAAASIEEIKEYLPDAQEMLTRLEQVAFELEDIGLSAEELIGEEDEEPGRELDRVEERLEKIGKLKKKYGDSVGEILAYRDRAESELREIQRSDELLAEAKKEFAVFKKAAAEAAAKLSEARKAAAARLETGVVGELAYLEMPKVRFAVQIRKATDASGKERFGKNGTDEVEFLLSANPGEPLKPLSKIASGGELSRIMLALKSVNAADSVGQTLIFDEIDTGVSGGTSQKIGKRLRRLADTHQVICVTHSAQIAAEAHAQYKIVKQERNGRVETEVLPLDREGRIREIARIMGGAEITAKLLSSSAELLDSAGPEPI